MTTIADHAGGPEAFRRLAEIQYARCLEDPVLQEIFGTEGRPDHVEHLAAWLNEVFGGEPVYTRRFGGHVEMVRHHVGRGIEERHRARFVEVTMEAAAEAGMPDDERFRKRLREYLDWGSRIALEYQDPDKPLPHGEPVPQWGWE
jgi:hemoglobin